MSAGRNFKDFPDKREPFAETFARLVGPALQQEVLAQALLVAQGWRTFGDAHEHVWDLAISKGVLHHNPKDMGKWEEWIASELLEAETVLTQANELYATGVLEAAKEEGRLKREKIAQEIADERTFCREAGQDRSNGLELTR